MATYKLIQDIEAEDHILGPLTLRQFIFALIAVFLFYINFVTITKHAAFLMVLFLPPALFFAFFAMPFGRDQPTEVWALAKIRYFIKPRQRAWNQSGVKELVTITAPKKIERVLTNGLSQTEVQSRLKALANTIDTRGWAVKNVSVDAFINPYPVAAGTDRLLGLDSMPQEVSDIGVTPADDILDERNSRISQQFDSMLTQVNQAHRQQIIDKLNATPGDGAGAQPDYWFMNGSGSRGAADMPAPQAAPIDSQQEAELVDQLKAQAAARPAPYSNLRTLKPSGSPAKKPGDAQSTQPARQAAAQQAQAVTPPPNPAILSLANNDDLNIATIAHEARRKDDQSSDEVTVSLR